MDPQILQKALTQALQNGNGKVFEVWSMQSLFDLSILFGLFATLMALMPDYYRSLEKHLTLRVSIEWWRVLAIVVTDVLLALTVGIGYLVLNPDLFADIKQAVPFTPIATVLFAIALVLRLFHRGHDLNSPNYMRSLYLMIVACLLNIVGYTFIMEAASGEYLKTYPSAGWQYIKATFVSRANPAGLALAQTTFWICFPILLIVFAWGVTSALKRLRAKNGE